MRQLADAWRTSVNDVCLTDLARAVRAWRRDGGPGACPDLPVLVAMSTRGPGQRYGPGNHVVGYRLLLPSSARRLAVRAAPHRGGEWAMGHVRNVVPLGVSSVTVIDEELTCLGARLTGASMFYDVHDGLLGYVSFTRAGGVVRCGVVYDAALPRAADLARH